MNGNIAKGKTIYFTGQFELGPQYRAERLGATIAKSMSEDVDLVVLGPGYSPTSLQQAQNFSIRALDEKRFFELVDPNAWNENEDRKARLLEEEKRRTAALEIKRATMPRVRAKARIVTDRDRCWRHGPARLIKEEDFLNLTAEQLREAILNGEYEPIVARDEDGDFLLLCSCGPDDFINFYPRTGEIFLYDDGSFDVVELEEYEDEDEDEDEDE